MPPVPAAPRCPWRALDQDGYEPDEILQIHRNAKAARRLLTRLLGKQGCPAQRIITDKLGSYAAAKCAVMPSTAKAIVSNPSSQYSPKHRPGG
jgi:putative transposase